MPVPAAVRRYMEEFDETDSEAVRTYVLESVKFFRKLPSPGTDEAGWIQHKMSCTRRDAESILKWAKRGDKQ